jgi:hypothetical protein
MGAKRDKEMKCWKLTKFPVMLSHIPSPVSRLHSWKLSPHVLCKSTN